MLYVNEELKSQLFVGLILYLFKFATIKCIKCYKLIALYRASQVSLILEQNYAITATVV